MTWEQRILCGRVLADHNKTTLQKARELVSIVPEFKSSRAQEPNPDDQFNFQLSTFNIQKTPTYKLLPQAQQIAEGVLYWAKREKEELYLQPTPEEMKAGIMELSHKLGETAAIVSVAKAYGKSPDEVLQWPYETVFMHLKVETEQERFARKLMRIEK